ncbi:MAG: DUF4142 domain-containing protein [Alphaproteobacteria bacterium]|nr:DUF4142 domain-containing protein [Alphaproteobacteria bacterium]
MAAAVLANLIFMPHSSLVFGCSTSAVRNGCRTCRLDLYAAEAELDAAGDKNFLSARSGTCPELDWPIRQRRPVSADGGFFSQRSRLHPPGSAEAAENGPEQQRAAFATSGAAALRPCPEAETADQSFLQKSAEAITSEIKLGQLAVDKASKPDVKQFGQQAVTDFGKAQQDLDKIAGDLKWIALDHMSQDAVGQYDDLWQRQGKDFDSR